VITFVFDRSLAPNLALSVRILLPEPGEPPLKGCAVHDVKDASQVECPPADFYPTLAREKSILVTCLAPKARGAVNAELKKIGLRVVHLAGGFNNLNPFQQAGRLLTYWTAIVNTSSVLKAGEAIVVRRDGGIEQL
jgi:hypothetical protein